MMQLPGSENKNLQISANLHSDLQSKPAAICSSYFVVLQSITCNDNRKMKAHL